MQRGEDGYGENLISITASDNCNLVHCILSVPLPVRYMFKVCLQSVLFQMQDCSHIQIAHIRLSDGKTCTVLSVPPHVNVQSSFLF